MSNNLYQKAKNIKVKSLIQIYIINLLYRYKDSLSLIISQLFEIVKNSLFSIINIFLLLFLPIVELIHCIRCLLLVKKEKSKYKLEDWQLDIFNKKINYYDTCYFFRKELLKDFLDKHK